LFPSCSHTRGRCEQLAGQPIARAPALTPGWPPPHGRCALRSPVVLDAQLFWRLLHHPALFFATRRPPLQRPRCVGDAATQPANGNRRITRAETMIRKIVLNLAGGEQQFLFTHLRTPTKLPHDLSPGIRVSRTVGWSAGGLRWHRHARSRYTVHQLQPSCDRHFCFGLIYLVTQRGAQADRSERNT